jgi:2-methylisocitrate lyase-like PEP mutase family enzyme
LKEIEEDFMGGITSRTKFRALLSGPHIIVAPCVWDPYTARVAERLGYECVAIGGYALGTHLVTSEPLLTLTEVANTCRYITAAVQIPVVVDAGTGWGEPLNVMRTVKELERAGAAAFHIEDQIFPKRVHYHKGVEHVVPMEEMMMRLKAALAARTDPDLVIIARTDAMRTDNFAEGVRRANLFLEAGADMVMIFPNTDEETRQAPKEIKGPIVYVQSEGNVLRRPLFSVKEFEEMGYKMVGYSATLICAVTQELKRVLISLRDQGVSGLPKEEMILWRKEVEDLIGLEEFYKIEEETMER